MCQVVVLEKSPKIYERKEETQHCDEWIRDSDHESDYSNYKFRREYLFSLYLILNDS